MNPVSSIPITLTPPSSLCLCASVVNSPQPFLTVLCSILFSGTVFTIRFT